MTREMDTTSVRRFYQRLNHTGHGVTELAVIDPRGNKGVVATGFFNDEDAFVRSCQTYHGKYNIYAGRNPRPEWLPKVLDNYLDTRYRQRAKDAEIQYITAVSLDIDAVRPKGTSSTVRQHESAIRFALGLQRDLGGWVDDSGNGANLWISFERAIELDDANRAEVKRQCRAWQQEIVDRYEPENTACGSTDVTTSPA